MPNYKFPSDRGFTAFEVEALSRRKKKEKVSAVFWLIILGTILATVLHFLDFPRITPVVEAHEPVVVIDGVDHSLCSQYVKDMALTGTSASETVSNYCNL